MECKIFGSPIFMGFVAVKACENVVKDDSLRAGNRLVLYIFSY